VRDILRCPRVAARQVGQVVEFDHLRAWTSLASGLIGVVVLAAAG
jgi:hypothetical protein